MLPEIHRAPVEGIRKVVLLRDADRMEPTVANSLLKSIEEPPPRTVVMLVTDRPEGLLATIRSRCQRVDSPALGQMLALVSSSEVQEKLAAPSGYAARLAASGHSHEDNVNDIFWRFFARPPRPEETQAACQHLANAADVPEAYRSLLWSLLATNEFLFNH